MEKERITKLDDKRDKLVEKIMYHYRKIDELRKSVNQIDSELNIIYPAYAKQLREDAKAGHKGNKE
jgi:hypothetical protein